VFVGFNGLSVAESTAMRNKLREEGVNYFVAKKTLIKRALGDAYEGSLPDLEGEVALAYSADEIAPAQNIKAFGKEYEDRVSILGGVFAGAYKNKEEMTEIASIPSLLVLRGMFVNVINSPIQGLVISLNQIAEKKSA
jgi:large subunit ribosomal protein L10